jgi:hypothetical protein
MKTKLCEVNAAALEKLPKLTDDKSGVGVHYVDAYIKPMNTKLADGTPVKCKRKGLRISLSAGGRKGDGLLRRLDVSRDPVVMLDAALRRVSNSRSRMPPYSLLWNRWSSQRDQLHDFDGSACIQRCTQRSIQRAQ